MFLAKELATPQHPSPADLEYAVKKVCKDAIFAAPQAFHYPFIFQVLACSGEKLDLVQKEIQLHASLTHRSILPLIDFEIHGSASLSAAAASNAQAFAEGFTSLNAAPNEDQDAGQAMAYLLFPACTQGEPAHTSLGTSARRMHALGPWLCRHTS